MLSSLSDAKKISHFCLIPNEEVKDQDASDNDGDDACTNDWDEVYDSLHNYSICKLIKILLYYIRH